MPDYSTESEVLVHLHRAYAAATCEAELARTIGVSRSHLNKIKRGHKRLSGRVLTWLGYRRVTLYTTDR